MIYNDKKIILNLIMFRGDLFNGFHQLMFPGLLFAAALHFICEFKNTDKISGLKMFRGLWVSMRGTFFMNIGPGVFWDHGYGYLGDLIFLNIYN